MPLQSSRASTSRSSLFWLRVAGNGVALLSSPFFAWIYVQRFDRYGWSVLLGAALAILLQAILAAAALLRLLRPPARPSYRRPSTLFVTRPILFLALLTWWVMRPGPPMGEGPAGPPVDPRAFASSWREGPVLFVALGDSVSTGFGAPEGLGFPALALRNHDEAYPEMRGLDLETVLPNLSLRLLAENSTNSLDHERVIAAIPRQHEETFGIVTITSGGIDLIHRYGKAAPREGAMYGASLEQARPWIANFESRLDRMMTALKERFPGGLAVFLATIYDPTDGVGDIENAGPIFWLPPWPDGLEILRRYNDAIREVVGRQDFVHLVDVHATMLGHGIHCGDPDNPHHDPGDPGYWYYLNLEDPNVRGYDAIRRTFLAAMAAVLAP